MNDLLDGLIRGASDGGIAAEHRQARTHPMLVGPATSDHFNTFRRRLIPFACWRLDDIRFEFDSSFVKPEAAEELTELVTLIEQHRNGDTKPPLSVFGHADPTGDDHYNKQLSGHRAQAIYALLTRETNLWEELYKQPLGGDNWGVKSVQVMLEAVGHSPGPIDGIQGAKTSAAIKSFQSEQGLAVDGIAGPNTRKKLFEVYMDLLCRDATGQPFHLKKTDFLARGEDPGGKGDCQGCSEFNPILLFSKQEEQEFVQSQDKSKRNAENAPNRRVVVFLYRPGSKVSAQRWPCPRVKEGIEDCKKRFWSDGEQRRNTRLPEERREFEKTEDTFACRFYHRMATRSPCEKVRQRRMGLRIRLLDSEKRAIQRAPYRLSVGDVEVRRGNADEMGILDEVDVVVPNQCTVWWGRKEQVDEERDIFPYQSTLFLDFDEGDDEQQARRRLHNLGYSPGESLEPSIFAFQRDYKFPPEKRTGKLDEETKAKLADVHDEMIASDEV